MTELCTVLIDQPHDFDRAVHGDDRLRSLPSGDDLQIITKNAAMQSGRAGAVITFAVDLGGGRLARAQFSVPVRQLKTVLRILDAAYDDDGFQR